MADPASYDNLDRSFDQTLRALKKGTQLIKYSRKGKPKFCTFRLSPDETTLLWYSRKAERTLKLSSVTRIIPGQRTPVFKRFLRPEKDYLSFSLIYNNGERSLDLICKDQAETEIWLGGLKSLTSTGQARNRQTKSEVYDFHGSVDSQDNHRPFGATVETLSSISRPRHSIDSTTSRESNNFFTPSSSHGWYEGTANMQQVRTSGADGFRISVSSTPSCSSQGSGHDDIESLGDVYLWGEIWLDGVAQDSNGNPIPVKTEVLTPQPLETNVVLDVHQLACGVRHIALVTRQGEVFTWGEESGGRLGHGIENDFSRPKLVEFLAVTNVDSVACGEFHTCALSTSGDLYTWGDGTHSAGLLGHGNDVSHWIPKRVSGFLEGHQVLSIACGTWHSALTTSSGKLFTFGDGTFGALGHGDRSSTPHPREVESLYGLKAVTVSCGVWHTAPIIEVTNQLGGGSNILSRKLFTWGDGDKNRLGHGNKETYFVPTCVSGLIDYNMHQIACGHNMTVALTNTGHVFTMGSNLYGQLGNPNSDGKLPGLVQDRLVGEFVEQISCGEHNIAALTSRSELFTWGRGLNGRLGHGDTEDRNLPTFVEALRDRHVRNIVCGSNYMTCICIHKWVSGADQSLCTGCRQAFGFTRKRHNCYHCGLVHCHACSSKKALKAALAPTPGKPHRVCDACFVKLKKMSEASNMSSTFNRKASNRRRSMDFSLRPDLRDVRGSSRVLLSPTVEPVKYHEIKSYAAKADNYSIVRASQVPSLLQLKDIAFPSSLSALQFGLRPVATTVPYPQPQTPPAVLPHTPPVQSNSRPASPYRRPSPPRSATPVFSRGVIDTLKKSNDLLTQEISKLHGQVKVLKQKSQAQESEIANLKQTASEATSLAADRSDKCIRAMQAAKSITDQLKEITEKLPPEISDCESFESIRDQLESFVDAVRIQEHEDTPESSHTRTLEHENQSDKASSSSANGSNTKEDHRTEEDHHNLNASEVDTNGSAGAHEQHTDQPESSTQHRHRSEVGRELMEQFEPGVYVTVLQLSNGTKIFKRIRFSKRRFSEQQASDWWKENRDRLHKKYKPPKVSHSSSSETVAAQTETETVAAQTETEEDSNQTETETVPEDDQPDTSS